MCAARDPVAHYYARDYALRLHAHELACLAELILAIYEKICQFAKLNSRKSFRLYGIWWPNNFVTWRHNNVVIAFKYTYNRPCVSSM